MPGNFLLNSSTTVLMASTLLDEYSTTSPARDASAQARSGTARKRNAARRVMAAPGRWREIPRMVPNPHVRMAPRRLARFAGVEHVQHDRAVVGARAPQRARLRLPHRSPAHHREAAGRAARPVRPGPAAGPVERGAELD